MGLGHHTDANSSTQPSPVLNNTLIIMNIIDSCKKIGPYIAKDINCIRMCLVVMYSYVHDIAWYNLCLHGSIHILLHDCAINFETAYPEIIVPPTLHERCLLPT